MPQVFDPPEIEPKPRFKGKLKPKVAPSASQAVVEAAYGKGPVTVAAARYIHAEHVRTAIDRWNLAAKAPIFRFTNSVRHADIVVRPTSVHYPRGSANDIIYEDSGLRSVKPARGFYPDPSRERGLIQMPEYDQTYPPFGKSQRAGLFAHELGHTLGLMHPTENAASPLWEVLFTHQGASRIMSKNIGSPSKAEGAAALRQVSLSPQLIASYREFLARLARLVEVA